MRALKTALKPAERRRSQRQYRSAKIKLKAGTVTRDCHVVDTSDGGVRLQVEGLDVADEFVLPIRQSARTQECKFKVVWRSGDEVGARFVSVVRSGLAMPDELDSY